MELSDLFRMGLGGQVTRPDDEGGGGMQISPLLMGAAWMGGDQFAQGLAGLQQKLRPQAAPAGLETAPAKPVATGITGTELQDVDNRIVPGIEPGGGAPSQAGLSRIWASLSPQRLNAMEPEDRRDMTSALLNIGRGYMDNA